MKVPVQVMVGGKKVRVEYVDALPDGDSGRIVLEDRLISISKSCHANEAAVFTTLFHELTHYAFAITGHSAEWTDAHEEPLVYALENMLADLFVFSPNAPIKYRDVEWPDED